MVCAGDVTDVVVISGEVVEALEVDSVDELLGWTDVVALAVVEEDGRVVMADLNEELEVPTVVLAEVGEAFL